MRLPCRATVRHWRDITQTVSKKAQRSLGGNGRIELPHGSGCCVARVDKRFFALGTVCDFQPLAVVQRLEIIAPHVDLASHFQHGGHRPGSNGLAAGPPQGGVSPLGGQRQRGG